MKLEVNRLEMLAAAKNAARVAPHRSPVDVLNGILVESNDDTGEVFLTATNHEVSIQQKVKASVMESGAMLVNARLLVNMMDLLEGDYVTLSSARPEILSVKGGSCRYQINCLSAKSYPKPVMPFPEETARITGICSLARRTVFAVSADEHKPALQCVQVRLKNNAVLAAACDGIKVMLLKDDAYSPDDREFLLPGRSLQLLASICKDTDEFEVGDVGNEVVFARNDMLFTMRKLLAGEYIDTNAIMKGIKPAYSAVTNADEMREALNVVAIGADRTPVNLIFSSGQIMLRRDTDYSQAQTAVSASVLKDTPKNGFFYEINSLVKLSQVINGRIKLEIDAKGFMIIKTKNEVYLQLPMRVPAQKAVETDKMKQAA